MVASTKKKIPKNYLCIRECYWNNARFKFGDPVVAHECPNHHFVELGPHDVMKSIRDILFERLIAEGVEVNTDWTDFQLQNVFYDTMEGAPDPEEERKKLIERAKEIGAIYHWRYGTRKLMLAIEEREAQMLATGELKEPEHGSDNERRVV